MMSRKGGPPADERNLQETLEGLGDGKLLQKLTEEAAAVVKGVATTKKKGEVVLKLKFSNAGGMVKVSAEVKATVPKEPVEETLFYATDDGALTKEDPKQLPLRNVTPLGGGLKTVKET